MIYFRFLPPFLFAVLPLYQFNSSNVYIVVFFNKEYVPKSTMVL